MPQKNYPPFKEFTIKEYDHEILRQELINFKYLDAMIQQAYDEPIEETHMNAKGLFSTFKPSNWPHHFPYTLKLQKKIKDTLLPLLPGIEISDTYIIGATNVNKFKGGEFSMFEVGKNNFPYHSDKWEGLTIPRYLDDYELNGEADRKNFNVLDHIQRIEKTNNSNNFSNIQTIAVAGLREVMGNLNMRSEEKSLFKELLLSDEEMARGDPEASYVATQKMREMINYCIKHSTGDRYEDDLIQLMIEYVDKHTKNTKENIEALFAQKPESEILRLYLSREGVDNFGDFLKMFFIGCPTLTLNFIVPSEKDITPEESGAVQVFDKWGNITTHNYRTGLLRIEHYHRVINMHSRNCLQTCIYGASYNEVYEAMEKIYWTF